MEPFLGEVRLMSFNFPPKGWALANGQTMQINQNQALFSLFGTMYGGDGRTTFALPNLQGRMAVGVGGGFTQGQVGGEYAVTISQGTLPTHNHFVLGDAVDGIANPTGSSRLANSSGAQAWGPANNLLTMSPSSIPAVGGSQPHDNMLPYLAINFIISLYGIYPTQS